MEILSVNRITAERSLSKNMVLNTNALLGERYKMLLNLVRYVEKCTLGILNIKI